MKYAYVLLLCLLSLDNLTAKKPRRVGGSEELQGKQFAEAKKILEDALSKVNLQFELIELKSASRQVVAGMSYKFKAVLRQGGDDIITNYDITLWIKTDNTGEITFKAEDGTDIIRTYSLD